MKLNTVNHPKFLKLRRLLCRPACTCAGVLELLWQMATMFADDGDLTKFTADDIAAFVDFDGDAEELLRSLIESGWLDSVGDRLLVHDWIDHCPDFISERLRKRSNRAAMSDSVRGCPELSGTVRNCPELSADFRISHSQAKPSQAKPKPSQQLAASGLLAENWLAVESLDERNEIVANANKLRKACKRLDPVFVWQTAWIGFCIERGWIGDKIDAIGNKERPETWLKAALRAECRERGFEFDECLKCVPSPPGVKEVVV